MAKRIAFGIAVFGLAGLGGAARPAAQFSAAPSCRHDQHSTAQDTARRSQALVLAKAINGAQAEAVRRTQTYQPLSNLRELPPLPSGFQLNLYADGGGYIFAIKDTTDPCRYAVFSDSVGLLYEKSALNAPVIAQ